MLEPLSSPFFCPRCGKVLSARDMRAEDCSRCGPAENLTEEARRARVMALWTLGRDTHSIGRELGIPEYEVCRILRDAREMRRGA